MASWSEARQAIWEAQQQQAVREEREAIRKAKQRQIGQEGGLDWITAGALGALMGVEEVALLTFLGSFAVHLCEARGIAYDEDVLVGSAREFLADYRAYLKEQGVANA